MISAFHLFYQVYLLRVYLTLRLKVRNNSIYSPLKNRLDLLYIIIYDFRHIHVFIMYANLFVLEIELYCLSSIAFYFLKFYLYSSKEEIYLYFIIFFIVYGIYSENAVILKFLGIKGTVGEIYFSSSPFCMGVIKGCI